MFLVHSSSVKGQLAVMICSLLLRNVFNFIVSTFILYTFSVCFLYTPWDRAVCSVYLLFLLELVEKEDYGG